MAFLRYVVSSSASNSNTSVKNIFDDLISWVEGSITATSGFNSSYCNIASSEIQGTIPANVYHNTYNNNNTSNSSDTVLRFSKYHSDWSSYNSSHPSSRMHIIWSTTGTYQLRMRVSNKNDGNMMPYPSTAYGHAGQSSSNYYTDFVPANTTILMWLEEDYMAIQMLESSNQDAIFMGSFDHPRSEYAEQCFLLDSEHSATVEVSALMNGTYNNIITPTYDWFSITAHDYYDQRGVNYAYPNNYSQLEPMRGYQITTSYEHLTLYPNAWLTMPQVPISGGSGHQLIPCFNSNNTAHDSEGNFPIFGRLKGLYRTTDNFAASGTSITYGGNQYRVCMMHRSGGVTNNADNVYNACYLLPVTV